MDYYVVDAFTSEIFRGNPAGVCVLDKEISPELMQKIAFENNLSETAFVRKTEEKYKLRWFTPGFEIDLCGHATLAASYVIATFVEPEVKQIEFETMSGILKVEKREKTFEMTFPNRPPRRIGITQKITDALGTESLELYSERDLYVVMKTEQEVKEFTPDYDKLQNLSEWLGIVITAPGIDTDFVSRYFCPELKLEDPVTGSSHSSLVPLWQKKTGKSKFLAKQLSQRGGVLYCQAGTNEVKISGEAALYLKGSIVISASDY